MKLKVLIDLFLQYYPSLIDVEELLGALKKIDPNIPLAERMVKIDAKLPPMAEQKTVAQRITDLEHSRELLTARVNSILKSMKEEIEKLEKKHG